MDDDLLRADEDDAYAREVLERKVGKVWNDMLSKLDLVWGKSNPGLRHRSWGQVYYE